MFDPKDKLKVELMVAEWNEFIAAAKGLLANTVIEGLVGMLRQSAMVTPLIAKIVDQATAHEPVREQPSNGAAAPEGVGTVQHLWPQSKTTDQSGDGPGAA